MISPVVLLSVTFLGLFSASRGSDEVVAPSSACYLSVDHRDDCPAVCYPIVKPLLRYFEKVNEKDSHILQLQKDNSELLEKYAEVLRQLNDVNVRYAKLQSQHLKVSHLHDLVDRKSGEIEQLKEQISDLKGASELGVLSSQFRESIAKLEEIVKKGVKYRTKVANKSNRRKSQIETPVKTGDDTETRVELARTLPDRCPTIQNKMSILLDIQIGGSDPFPVVCYADKWIGYGWMTVYRKTRFLSSLNRTYEEYVNGFGNVGTEYNDEFFIGLQRLHLLTSGAPHEVRVAQFQGGVICGNFVIGNRSEGYMIRSMGSCAGRTWLSFKRGNRFSTFDRDEDGQDDRNLAMEWGHGWWFDSTWRMDESIPKIELHVLIRRSNGT